MAHRRNAHSKARDERVTERLRQMREAMRSEPCRNKTNIVHPDGECLRCAAANGEACRDR